MGNSHTTHKKVVVITGCGDGIGRALAEEYAGHGHRVYATSRTASKMKGLKEKGVLDTMELDVTKQGSVDAVVKQVGASHAWGGPCMVPFSTGR